MIKKNTSRRTIGIFSIILLSLIVFCTAGYYLWQANKIDFVEKRIKKSVSQQTDSLYTIKFDSLYFDETNGDAYMLNVHIQPDTAKALLMPIEERPQILADIKFASMKLNGVKTSAALTGSAYIGDSVIINQPVIKLYLLKRLKKETNISKEAGGLYRQILGKLKSIQASKVVIRDINLSAIDLTSGHTDFELLNAQVNLFDVKIDSLHEQDTSRILFTKHTYVLAEQFNTYDNGRPEGVMKTIAFLGKEKKLSVGEFSINRHKDENGPGDKVAIIKDFACAGINTDAFIKEKMIIIDTVSASSIVFYRQAKLFAGLKSRRSKPGSDEDSTGFSKIYGVNINHLLFPNILIKNGPTVTNKEITSGKITLALTSIKADQLRQLKEQPLKHFDEINVTCDDLAFDNKRATYQTSLRGLKFNSATNTASIERFTFLPKLQEQAFAKRAEVQKDRYEIRLNNIKLSAIDLEALMENKLIAQNLSVDNSSIKVYRDLSYRLEPKSKVGNYPHQVLLKSEMPINIRSGIFKNLFLEYMEKNPLSDSSGKVKLENTTITMSNITNMPNVIVKNKTMSITLRSTVLGSLPFEMITDFNLAASNGEFKVTGSTGKTDARNLNTISRPLALVEINSGKFNSLKFNFNGNNHYAKGDIEFLYEDLKIKLLKIDEDGGKFKTKSVMSFIANKFVKDNNPKNGSTRRYLVRYERDPYKSFLNLVWKTIFTGLQETLGLPGKRNAVQKS